MSTAIVAMPSESNRPNTIIPRTIDEVVVLSKIAQESNNFGIRHPSEAAVRIMYGLELGLSPYQSLMGITVIQGKPTMAANTVAAMVKRSGRYNYKIVRWDATACELEFYEHGQMCGSATFSIDDARRAGLIKGGGGWEKFPKAMLFARALTQGARAYCPDVFLGGIYTPDEIDDTLQPSIQPVVTQSTPQEPESKPVRVQVEHPIKKWLEDQYGNDSQARRNAIKATYDEAFKLGMCEPASDDLQAWKRVKDMFDNGTIDLQWVADCNCLQSEEPEPELIDDIA